jgi:hypothetical protein
MADKDEAQAILLGRKLYFTDKEFDKEAEKYLNKLNVYEDIFNHVEGEL